MSQRNPISMKFKFLGENLRELSSAIKNNQSILRMIYYLTDDPLASETTDRNGNLVIQDDITSDIVNEKNNILFQHFDSNTIEKDSTVKVFINPIHGNLRDLATNRNIFSIDFVIPNIYWELQGQCLIRPIEMASFLAEQIDNQNDITGVGRLYIVEYKSDKLSGSDSYSYFTLFVQIDNSSIDSEYPEEEE